MEQNPLTQPHTPFYDKRKVYISALVLLVLVLGTIFVIKTFGTPNYKKIKEDLAGRIDQSRVVDKTEKENLTQSVNQENKATLSNDDLQARKQQLINQIK